MRLISGLVVSAITLSMFAASIPNSSAWIIANTDHITMSFHWESFWRTTGPSGSLEIVSGRIANSEVSGALARVEARLDLSLVMASQPPVKNVRSEEHTSELQSLMRISYAVFCLKKKKNISEKIK